MGGQRNRGTERKRACQQCHGLWGPSTKAHLTHHMQPQLFRRCRDPRPRAQGVVWSRVLLCSGTWPALLGLHSHLALQNCILGKCGTCCRNSSRHHVLEERRLQVPGRDRRPRTGVLPHCGRHLGDLSGGSSCVHLDTRGPAARSSRPRASCLLVWLLPACQWSPLVRVPQEVNFRAAWDLGLFSCTLVKL